VLRVVLEEHNSLQVVGQECFSGGHCTFLATLKHLRELHQRDYGMQDFRQLFLDKINYCNIRLAALKYCNIRALQNQ